MLFVPNSSYVYQQQPEPANNYWRGGNPGYSCLQNAKKAAITSTGLSLDPNYTLINLSIAPDIYFQLL